MRHRRGRIKKGSRRGGELEKALKLLGQLESDLHPPDNPHFQERIAEYLFLRKISFNQF